MKNVLDYLTERASVSVKSELIYNDELTKAVLLGDVQKVKEEFKKVPNSDPDATDSQGRTLLYMCRDKEIAKILINQGANVNAVNTKGQSILAHVAYYHRLEIMELMLKAGANPNVVYAPNEDHNESGLTPLHFMCSHDKIEMVELLVKKKADINANNNPFKETPLMTCFRYKSLAKKSARFLLSKGADKTLVNVVGSTALDFARVRTKDKNILELLEF